MPPLTGWLGWQLAQAVCGPPLATSLGTSSWQVVQLMFAARPGAWGVWQLVHALCPSTTPVCRAATSSWQLSQLATFWRGAWAGPVWQPEQS